MTDRKDMMWSVLLHLSMNEWSDVQWDREEKDRDPANSYSIRKLRFEEPLYRDCIDRMVAGGLNTLILDIGDGMIMPSHPEIAAEGAWTQEKLREEIVRLEKLGIEVIPKLNFSTCHDVWMKEYHRMVSTPDYYAFCRDAIADVIAAFPKPPRFFHLGYDEEVTHLQVLPRYIYACIRTGELWWHDFLFFVREVERHGVRAWIWSDYIWKHEEEFLRRMPRSVMQSNWYYGRSWDVDRPDQKWLAPVLPAFIKLAKAGFEQVPTGSNWIPDYYKKGENNDSNFGNLVKWCRDNVDAASLKGFMNTPWCMTMEGGDRRKKLMDSIDQVAAEIRRA